MKFYIKLLISFFLFYFIFLSSNTISHANSPKNSFHFSKTHSTISVSKKVHYCVKKLKKGYYCRYFVTSKKYAVINKKSGWLKAKKAGTTTVKAAVYNRKHKKIAVLKDKIIIKKILSNASFHVVNSINSFNFTIQLKCSRILLKKEVKKSHLYIQLSKSKSHKYTANFTKLSSNGKTLTYTLTAQAQKKLCPKTQSKDGTYFLASDFFSKKLSIKYKERIHKNTLSGFVLSQNGSPIKEAFVSLKTSGKLLTTTTDTSGKYEFVTTQKPSSITASKSGFFSQHLALSELSPKGVLCENFVLRSSKETNVFMEYFVTDTNQKPLANTIVSITPISSQKVILEGVTDQNGRVSFSNSTTVSPDCSFIEINKDMHLSYLSNFTPYTSNMKLTSYSILNPTSSYDVYFKRNDTATSSFQSQKFSFSYENLISNQSILHVTLSQNPATSFHDLSIKWDSNVLLSSIHHGTLSIYQPEIKKPVYQNTYSKDKLNISANRLFLPSDSTLALSDSNFFLRLAFYSSDGSLAAQTSIMPFTVQNGIASANEITILPAKFSRILSYGDSLLDGENVYFSLYQISDSKYFYLDQIKSTPFSQSNSNYSISQLYLSQLLPNQNYVLISHNHSIMSETYYAFTASNDHLYSSLYEAKFSKTPLGKVFCIPKSEVRSTKIYPDNFNSNATTLSAQKSFFLTQDFIRKSPSYPNCVTAYYNFNGSFSSLSLSNPLTTIFSNISKASSLITDVYKNKGILITNQNSYQ